MIDYSKIDLSRRMLVAPDRVQKSEAVCIGNQNYGLLGVLGSDGARGVVVSHRGIECYVPLNAFLNNEFKKVLENYGVFVFSGVVAQEIRHKVGEITQFINFPHVVTSPGWTGCRFTLGDGTIFQPKESRKPIVYIKSVDGSFGFQSSVEDWKDQVASPLIDQTVPMFFIMCSFVGPLLELFESSGNFGFEISGPTRTGKSLALELMASAIGPAHINAKGNFLLSARRAQTRECIEQRADLAIIIDDPVFVETTAKPGGRPALNSLITTLYGAAVKHASVEDGARLVYATSSRERLAARLDGSGPSVSEIARDRLITIPLAADRPHGVFDAVPEGYSDAADFADVMRRAVERCHGQALRAFLPQLVASRHDGEGKLKGWLDARRKRFLNDVMPDPLNGAAEAVAEVFAKVYAAARLAQRFDVLPQAWKCLTAVKAVYRLHLAAEQTRSFFDRLLALARRPDTYDINERGLASLEDDEMHEYAAFVRTNRAGERELLLTSVQLRRALRDWLTIKDQPETRSRICTHRGRDQTQSQIRLNKKKDRVYCFRIEGALQD